MADKLVLKSRRLRGDDGYKIVSVRMKETLLDRVGTLADETGHSRNELFSILINYALDNCIVQDKL